MSLFLELVLLDQAVRMNLRIVGQILEWKKHLAGHESTCKLNKLIGGHPYFSRVGRSRSLGSYITSTAAWMSVNAKIIDVIVFLREHFHSFLFNVASVGAQRFQDSQIGRFPFTSGQHSRLRCTNQSDELASDDYGGFVFG